MNGFFIFQYNARQTIPIRMCQVQHKDSISTFQPLPHSPAPASYPGVLGFFLKFLGTWKSRRLLVLLSISCEICVLIAVVGKINRPESFDIAEDQCCSSAIT